MAAHRVRVTPTELRVQKPRAAIHKYTHSDWESEYLSRNSHLKVCFLLEKSTATLALISLHYDHSAGTDTYNMNHSVYGSFAFIVRLAF